MSANGTITVIWAGGEDQFCLSKVGDILALEDKCKAGIAIIAGRLESGAWGINDIRETIRLGLMGGGKSPADAMAAVNRFVDEKPLAPSVLLAYEIIKSVIFGIPQDDPVGKPKPEAWDEAGSTTTTDASVDPKSSRSVRPSPGRRGLRKSKRSGN